ncbi:MAG: rod shape-determining protein RodA [Acidobacteria bacterium]|nr:rod shape-determining protein RodA [Acidobacteriota bacterium]
MFERRLYFHLDWLLLVAILTLCGIGVLTIYSATYDPTKHAAASLFRTQLYAIGIGLGALLFCLALDYRHLASSSLIFYAGTLVLLIYVLVSGAVRGGAGRWIPLGLVNLQPSEFAKLAVALVLALLFGEGHRGARSTGDLLLGGAFVAVPFVLIAREPDLGTALTLLPIYLGIAYVAGLRMRLLAVVLGLAIVAAPFAWTYALKEYQRSRLQTFVNPEQDPRGAGYQQIQARITVGSGGLRGKGFLQGTQGQYKFLPVAHNDFIFSVLAEERGFIGVLVTLGLYLFVILRSLEAARLSKDRLGAYLVAGVISGFTFQVIYNITMSAGLAPVKGLTLPLMSYGGSSMIATLAGFGLILNVRMRRFTN